MGLVDGVIVTPCLVMGEVMLVRTLLVGVARPMVASDCGELKSKVTVTCSAQVVPEHASNATIHISRCK